MMLFIFAGFVVISKIKQKTKEIGEQKWLFLQC
jgi:hypothetical protein